MKRVCFIGSEVNYEWAKRELNTEVKKCPQVNPDAIDAFLQEELGLTLLSGLLSAICGREDSLRIVVVDDAAYIKRPLEFLEAIHAIAKKLYYHPHLIVVLGSEATQKVVKTAVESGVCFPFDHNKSPASHLFDLVRQSEKTHVQVSRRTLFGIIGAVALVIPYLVPFGTFYFQHSAELENVNVDWTAALTLVDRRDSSGGMNWHIAEFAVVNKSTNPLRGIELRAKSGHDAIFQVPERFEDLVAPGATLTKQFSIGLKPGASVDFEVKGFQGFQRLRLTDPSPDLKRSPDAPGSLK